LTSQTKRCCDYSEHRWDTWIWGHYKRCWRDLSANVDTQATYEITANVKVRPTYITWHVYCISFYLKLLSYGVGLTMTCILIPC